MKQLFLSFTLLLGAFSAVAQDLPKLSPMSKSEHVVGVTKISIQYSRPSVRGRVIFGDVVPYNEVWRLGANEPTKITTSEILIFSTGGDSIQMLSPGTYAIFAFPAADGNWRIVINSDIEQWGAGNYDASKNIIDLQVKATENQFTETLLIDINQITPYGASLVIAWDKLKVSVPFSVDTKTHAERNIQDAVAAGKELGKVYNAAANYHLNITEDYKAGITYADQSIALQKTYSNLFLKARLIQKQGDTKQAIKLAEEAKSLAEAEKNERWVSYIQETIDAWKKL